MDVPEEPPVAIDLVEPRVGLEHDAATDRRETTSAVRAARE